MKDNKLSLYYTRIQKAQISHENVPEEKKREFKRLCDELHINELNTTGALFSEPRAKGIPLATFPLRFSDCKTYDKVRKNKKGHKEALDAVIAQTATDNELDYIVTEDKIFNGENLSIPVINFHEFKKIIENI